MNSAERYWSPINSRFGRFAAWVDGEGRLLRLHLTDEGAPVVEPLAQKSRKKLGHVQQQVDEYAAGKRRTFDLELCPEGPAFSQLVWRALADIGFGQTISYAGLARRVGHPHAARAVGAAMGKNPIALILPCHRVIGSNGRLVGYGGGLALKRKLLEHEARIAGTKLDLLGGSGDPSPAPASRTKKNRPQGCTAQ